MVWRKNGLPLYVSIFSSGAALIALNLNSESDWKDILKKKRLYTSSAESRTSRNRLWLLRSVLQYLSSFCLFLGPFLLFEHIVFALFRWTFVAGLAIFSPQKDFDIRKSWYTVWASDRDSGPKLSWNPLYDKPDSRVERLWTQRFGQFQHFSIHEWLKLLPVEKMKSSSQTKHDLLFSCTSLFATI